MWQSPHSSAATHTEHAMGEGLWTQCPGPRAVRCGHVTECQPIGCDHQYYSLIWGNEEETDLNNDTFSSTLPGLLTLTQILTGNRVTKMMAIMTTAIMMAITTVITVVSGHFSAPHPVSLHPDLGIIPPPFTDNWVSKGMFLHKPRKWSHVT